MSTSSIWSAERTTSSGTVSCWRMPVIDSTTSLSDSRCWMFTVVITSMPASSSSSTSCQRLALRRAGDVGVGQLVDQGHLGSAGQDGVQVHLGERRPAVLDHAAGHHLQALDQRRGVLPAVGLHEADHHVGPAASAPVALGEHGVGLAHARGRAHVDAQGARRLPAESDATPPARLVGRHRRGTSTALSLSDTSRPAQCIEGQVELEDVDPRLAEEPQRPCPGCARRPGRHLRPAVSPRAPATRATWRAAYSGEMCGSSPEAEAVTASGGHLVRATRRSRAATAARRSSIVCDQVRVVRAEVGPAGGQRRRTRRRDGRGQKYSGGVERPGPSSAEPTTVPSTSTRRAVGPWPACDRPTANTASG